VPAGPDPVRQKQWYLDFLHIEQVHQISRGAGVTVALIDTGVDAGHPDLAGSVLAGTDFGPMKSDGRTDTFGHGTAMAGLIAGHGRILGIAPEAKILPVKPVFTNDNGGVADSEEPVRWAVDHGATVISMSIGDDAPTPAWGRAIQYALSKDVVVVAAVSNKGQGTHPTGLAMTPGVVVVSGVDQTGKFDPISLTGDVVTVAAPSRDCWSTRIGGGYGGSTGTSNSAAITSGVVALIRSHFPDLDGPGVVRRLTATAHDQGTDGRDPLYGFGVIDPLRALTAPLPSDTSSASESASAEPSPTAQAEEPTSDHPLWMLLAIAGGALAVAVGLALIGRLRR
jgi:type VII secretion-associated serine protease mycosin